MKYMYDHLTDREEELVSVGVLAVTNIMAFHPALKGTMDHVATDLLAALMGPRITQGRVSNAEQLAHDIARAFFVLQGVNVAKAEPAEDATKLDKPANS
jgi:hypothetical protein